MLPWTAFVGDLGEHVLTQIISGAHPEPWSAHPEIFGAHPGIFHFVKQ